MATEAEQDQESHWLATPRQDKFEDTVEVAQHREEWKFMTVNLSNSK